MLGPALDARVSPEALRKIETGRVATPALPTIAAIADVLGLSLDAVWAEITSPSVVVNRPALATTHVSGWPRNLKPAAALEASTRDKPRARLSANVPGREAGSSRWMVRPGVS